FPAVSIRLLLTKDAIRASIDLTLKGIAQSSRTSMLLPMTLATLRQRVSQKNNSNLSMSFAAIICAREESLRLEEIQTRSDDRSLRRFDALGLAAIAPAPRQHRLEELPRVACRLAHDVFRRAGRDNLAAAVAA